MFDGSYTRRAMLRRGLAAVGAGTLVSTAGCSGGIPNPLGGGSGVYADWLPAPDELGDRDHYQFYYFDAETIEANEDELNDENFDFDSVEDSWTPLSFDWEDATTILYLGLNIVVEAAFNREDAIEDLEAEDFDDEPEHEGYSIYLNPTETRAFGVGDGTVVVTSAYGTEDPVDTIEAIIDAKAGNADRYADDSEDMGLLIDELSSETTVSGRTSEEPSDEDPASGRFDDMVARGNTATINGETTDRKWVVVYDNERNVDIDDLEEWVDENDGNDQLFDDVDDISYESSGRAGIITGTVDTGEL